MDFCILKSVNRDATRFTLSRLLKSKRNSVTSCRNIQQLVFFVLKYNFYLSHCYSIAWDRL